MESKDLDEARQKVKAMDNHFLQARKKVEETYEKMLSESRRRTKKKPTYDDEETKPDWYHDANIVIWIFLEEAISINNNNFGMEEKERSKKLIQVLCKKHKIRF